MASGIRNVGFFTASGPVETCDRCGQGIRHVAVVLWADGTRQRFGLDCINRVLEGDTSLRRLFNKNRKLAEQYGRWIKVLRRPVEEWPRGSEYYDSGLFFVGDGQMDISANGRWQFHPLPDWDKNQGGDRYVQTMTPEAYRAKREQESAEMLAWLEREHARIGAFLARVLAKAGLKAAA